VHRRDRSGNTLLHMVIGGETFLKPALIQRVWEMNPDALFVANAHGYTPFDCALSSVHEWVIEHFQWKFSLWSVEESLAKVKQRKYAYSIKEGKVLQQREQRFRDLVQGECESLLMSLPRDCVCFIISDYLFKNSVFISDSTIDRLLVGPS